MPSAGVTGSPATVKPHLKARTNPERRTTGGVAPTSSPPARAEDFALYPSELFPTSIRATAMSVVFNLARFPAAIGALLTPTLISAFGSISTAAIVIGCCRLPRPPTAVRAEHDADAGAVRNGAGGKPADRVADDPSRPRRRGSPARCPDARRAGRSRGTRGAIGELLSPDSPVADQVRELVLDASALVVASPVFKATYTGLLKVFLDRFAAGALGGVLDQWWAQADAFLTAVPYPALEATG